MKKALALVAFALALEGAVLLQLASPPLPEAGAAAAVVAQARPSAGGPAASRPSAASSCRDGAKKC